MAPVLPRRLGTDDVVAYCPGCGSGHAIPVTAGTADAGSTTNVLCLACGSCWHEEPGRVERVNPRDCPGCPSQPVCLAGEF